MFPDRQEEPIEIDLLLLREPGPLPDAGKQLFHNTRARSASVARHAGRDREIFFICDCFRTHAFRACPARRAVSQCGDGISDSFRHLSQNTGFIGQIDDVVF